MFASTLQWLAFAALIVMLALLYLAPGALVLAATGERRWHRYGLAVPLTVTITTITAVIAARANIDYGPLPVLGVTLLAAGVAWPLRWLRGETKTVTPRALPARIPNRTLLGAAAGMGLLTWVRTAINIAHPWAPSQTYDAVYHLNVLAMIRARPVASPWQMEISSYPQPAGFYPNGWHQVTALGLPLVSDIPTLANASALAIITVIWPLSLAGLVWAVSNGRRTWVLAALLLSQALPQFPQMFFTFGSLYPNLLGFAFLPAVLAVGRDLLWERHWRPAVVLLALALLATPGIAISHPATVVAIGLLAPAFIAARLVVFLPRGRAEGKHTHLPRVALALVINLVLIAAMYLVAGRVPRLAAMQSFDPNGWQPTSSGFKIAIIKAGTLAAGTWFSHGFYLSWMLGLLVVVGAWVAVQRLRTLPLALMHLLTAVLFIVADGDWNLSRRAYLTGFFYTDPMRLAALLAITAVPLLALGTAQVANSVRKWAGKQARCQPKGENLRHMFTNSRHASANGFHPDANHLHPDAYPQPARGQVKSEGDQWSRATGAALLLVATISQLMPGFFFLANYTQEAYLLPPTQAGRTGMLTADEYQLLRRVGQHVPQTDTVLGNPWTGTAFVWALAGRQAVFPDMASQGGGIYGWRLGKAANQIMDHPTGCEAVEQRRAYWVLDFGHHYLWNGEDPSKRYEFFNGLEGLREAGYAEVVDQQGDAKLLRITHCGEGAKEKP